jgi:uncharacterized membrane protein YphA (DoxX/SURF4 family)
MKIDAKTVIIAILLAVVVYLFIMHTSTKMMESFIPVPQEMSEMPLTPAVIPDISAEADKINEMYKEAPLDITGYSTDDSHARVEF